MFEPVCISFGDGVTVASGIVEPDQFGCFHITIQNDLDVDYELPDDILIGHVTELATSSRQEETPITRHPETVRCIWNVQYTDSVEGRFGYKYPGNDACFVDTVPPPVTFNLAKEELVGERAPYDGMSAWKSPKSLVSSSSDCLLYTSPSPRD